MFFRLFFGKSSRGVIIIPRMGERACEGVDGAGRVGGGEERQRKVK